MVLLVLLKKELVDSLRNRWLIFYIILFAGLGIGFAYYSSLGLSVLGFRMFSRVSAAMINMILYLVPLLAMFLTGLSIVGEREKGTIEMLLSSPISRSEIILSKYFGAVLSIMLATTLGYGITAWYLWIFLSSADLIIFLQIVGISILLASTFAAIGIAVSVISRSRFKALSILLAIWFLLLIIFDTIIMGVATALNLEPAVLFLLMAVNPIESARILMVFSIDPTLLLLGPLSNYVVRNIGQSLPLMLIASQLIWLISSLIVANRIFQKQDM